MRETRIQRYKIKEETAKFLPVSLVTVQFQLECNLGLVIRSAACFGVKDVHVIGFIPPFAELRSNSGSTNHFVKLHQHSTPSEFLSWRRKEDLDSDLISMELTESAESLIGFQVKRHSYLVIGNETTGVPTEILHQSDRTVYIPMPGIGYCLNAAFSSHVLLYELSRNSNAAA